MGYGGSTSRGKGGGLPAYSTVPENSEPVREIQDKATGEHYDSTTLSAVTVTSNTESVNAGVTSSLSTTDIFGIDLGIGLF